jgi:hypothetical protein
MAYLRLGSMFLATSLLLVTLCFVPQVSAQFQPDINLDCPDSTVEIEVGPGDSRVGSVTCTLENPSLHSEDINISVENIGLNVAYPGSVSVGPNSEQTFMVSWSAEVNANVESFTSSIEATVTSANGAPWLLGNSKSESVNIEIMPFGRPWIDMEGQELSLNYGGQSTLNFSMRNTGNAEDTLSLVMVNQSGLEEFGFTFEYSDTSAKLGVNQSKDIILTITASEGIADGSFVVILQVDSQLADESGNPWVVEDNFRLQSIAEEESFLSSSVDNVPAWAITAAMVLAGLAVVAVIVVAVKLGMSRSGSTTTEFDFEDDLGDDFDLEDEEFDDFGLDDL